MYWGIWRIYLAIVNMLSCFYHATCTNIASGLLWCFDSLTEWCRRCPRRCRDLVDMWSHTRCVTARKIRSIGLQRCFTRRIHSKISVYNKHMHVDRCLLQRRLFSVMVKSRESPRKRCCRIWANPSQIQALHSLCEYMYSINTLVELPGVSPQFSVIWLRYYM